ncbi:Pentatricopeptide repeat [Quillaja saponaria]|uniref:Pentatricopeptide repeat n=1 Tax=Quillaja saponaria TaxID=32244 RepID=A0AAD7VKQ3_QUISA|nr:Pentatricopeptide repeat [Quillaja saponaria]
MGMFYVLVVTWGFVEKGFDNYNSIILCLNIMIRPELDHCACMVDLLGRGLLDEARKFIASMSIAPDSAIWGALLGACRVHGNAEMGHRVGDRSHEKTEEIYLVWGEIVEKIKKFGYNAETKVVGFDVEEEEKEALIGYQYHS